MDLASSSSIERTSINIDVARLQYRLEALQLCGTNPPRYLLLFDSGMEGGPFTRRSALTLASRFRI